jgi:hypothetical protein
MQDGKKCKAYLMYIFSLQRREGAPTQPLSRCIKAVADFSDYHSVAYCGAGVDAT